MSAAAPSSDLPGTNHQVDNNNNNTDSSEREETTRTPPPRDDEDASVGVDDDDDTSDNNDNAVEVEDVLSSEDDRKDPGLLRELLYRMNPTQCLPTTQCFSAAAAAAAASAQSSSCHNPFLCDEVDVEDVTALLLKDIQHEGKSRTVALQKLYRLTDKERKENRYVTCRVLQTIELLFLRKGDCQKLKR